MGDGGGTELVDKGMNGAMAVREDVAGMYDSGIKGAIIGNGLGWSAGASEAASGGVRKDGATIGAAVVGRDIDSAGGDNRIKGAMVGEVDGVSLVPSQSPHCKAKTQSEVGSEGASPTDAMPLPKMADIVPF
jgi:hypothetical protein